MLQWLGFDKLKLYAVLVFSVSLIIRLIYGLYCKYKFKESKFRFFWDKLLFSTLISFAGWNLWGHISSVMKGQGVNVLLNIFSPFRGTFIILSLTTFLTNNLLCLICFYIFMKLNIAKTRQNNCKNIKINIKFTHFL